MCVNYMSVNDLLVTIRNTGYGQRANAAIAVRQLTLI